MLVLKLILGVILQPVIFGGLLLLPAGTARWWRAWLFIGVMTAIAAWSSFRLPRELLAERFKSPMQSGQPLADKIVVVLFVTTFLVWMVFIPLDVFRFHWMGKPGTLASALGLVLLVAGSWITYLSLRENAFAIPAVVHQEERQHAVVDTGVYGVVRHPMYAGGVLLLVGTPLWLESDAAALLASVPIGTLVLRVLVEEQFLRRELNGYVAYARRVPYRLIPFLW